MDSHRCVYSNTPITGHTSHIKPKNSLQAATPGIVFRKMLTSVTLILTRLFPKYYFKLTIFIDLFFMYVGELSADAWKDQRSNMHTPSTWLFFKDTFCYNNLQK